MKIIIAICTYNRANLLKETLECIKEIKKPDACEYSIVVVDNCCTDDTDSVVETYKNTLPIFLIHESKPGLSNARNAAIKEAERVGSDYILWTDDDVRPHEDWLHEYVRTFKDRPEIAIAGGTIEPWFESPPRNGY
jgi:glycosyltransferase involved in cell wall biosynthesis